MCSLRLGGEFCEESDEKSSAGECWLIEDVAIIHLSPSIALYRPLSALSNIFDGKSDGKNGAP
jgi:hypothetical protein